MVSFFFVLSPILYGAYYVAPGGNDWGPGSFDEPWETIAKATETMVAGDTTFIREGVYYQRAGFNNSGTAEEKIVLMAYENENVVMDGSEISNTLLYIPRNHIEIANIKFRNGHNWAIFLLDCSNVKIQNCEIQDNLLSGIRVLTSSNIELVNNTFENNSPNEHWGGAIWASVITNILVTNNNVNNCPAYGIMIEHSANVIVENNYTYNTIHSGIAIAGSDSVRVFDNEIALACNGSYSECLSLNDCHDFLVYNNEVHTSGIVTYGGEGISAGGGSYNGKVYNNYVHDLDKVSIYVCEGDNYTHDIEVFGNIVDKCDNGIAVGSEGGGPVENISIYRNIVSNCVGIGINVAPWVEDGLRKDIKIHNNTFYKNAGGIVIETSNVENISVLNNICSENIVFQIAIVHEEAIEDVTVEYNIFDGEQIDDVSLYSEHYILDSPEFADTANMDFHLTENSPAIDEGHPDPQYNDPDGTRNDIGAYYYDQSGGVISDTSPFVLDCPNLIGSSTVISYSIQRADFITLKIYDLLGREIQTLVNEFQEANTYSYNVRHLASGIYYVKLQVGNDFQITRKMILIQ